MQTGDPAALVIGPTGLALNAAAENLYVNDSLSNRIAAIGEPVTRLSSAGTGKTISQNGSLNERRAENGPPFPDAPPCR